MSPIFRSRLPRLEVLLQFSDTSNCDNFTISENGYLPNHVNHDYYHINIDKYQLKFSKTTTTKSFKDLLNTEPNLGYIIICPLKFE